MPDDLCPCHSQKRYAICCEPFLTHRAVARTPEQLMRSRYTAYSKAHIDYIEETMCGPVALGFNKQQARDWASRVIWQGLSVLSATQQQDVGEVEFVAFFLEAGQLQSIQERSVFERKKGRWYYVDHKE